MRVLKLIVVLCFALITVAVLVGRLGLFPNNNPAVQSQLVEGSDQARLFVYIHGFDRGHHWDSIRSALEQHGDVAIMKYNPRSNADPIAVSGNIVESIKALALDGSYEKIVLLGQSMGALLARRAYLLAEESGEPWADKVQRIVLLAGMNRGWDISGNKPADMDFGTWASIWIGSWASRLVGQSGLILETEAGAPFVANLRLDWVARMADDPDQVEVVQLLGDIDDLVSEEDNKDLRSIPDGRFAWIKVRGTDHGGIADFADDTAYGDTTMGEYRRDKVLLAATGDFTEVSKANEEQAYRPDREVTHIVFVLHGIRDLGEWAAGFDVALHKAFENHKLEGKLAIVSARYGYFGMGPFLLKPAREKYVKWFMDEYTEARARFPNAENIHFVGHSNGTYLLAAALERYRSMRVDRIVFGGSVVKKGYDWDKLVKNGQVKSVRNYRAADDWVVALFPRFFEPDAAVALLGNDIGSAGFNGFENDSDMVENVGYLKGGHGAFLNRIGEIADYVLVGKDAQVNLEFPASEQNALLTLGSKWGVWLLVFPLLVGLVLYVGWHFITAAPEPRWPLVLVYVGLLLLILREV